MSRTLDKLLVGVLAVLAVAGFVLTVILMWPLVLVMLFTAILVSLIGQFKNRFLTN